MNKRNPILTLTIPNSIAFDVLVCALETRSNWFGDEFRDNIVINEDDDSGTIDDIIPCMNAHENGQVVSVLLERAMTLSSIFTEEGIANHTFPIFSGEEQTELFNALDCALDIAHDFAFESLPIVQAERTEVVIGQERATEKRTALQHNLNTIRYAAWFIGSLKQ